MEPTFASTGLKRMLGKALFSPTPPGGCQDNLLAQGRAFPHEVFSTSMTRENGLVACVSRFTPHGFRSPGI